MPCSSPPKRVARDMDHHLGQIDLVSWQGQRNRRIRPGLSPWTVMLALSAVLGLGMTTAQAAGWLHLPGLLAAAPAGLVLLAVSVQFVAVVRGLLVWLSG